MRILLIVLSFLFSLNNTLAKLDNRTCAQRYQDVRSACMRTQTACHELNYCQNIRTKCPQNHTTVAGCEDFKQCVVEDANQNQENLYCVYKWSGNPNTGQCYLRNLPEDSFSKSCPGINNLLSALNDSEYNCEGHKSFYQTKASRCEQERRTYTTLCNRSELDIDSFRVHNCSAANDTVTVNESDMPDQVIADGNREQGYSQKIINGLGSNLNDIIGQGNNSQSR